jgi:hypothetical protein
MNEEIVVCYACSFKCVKSQLYKTRGKCPKCEKLLSKSIKNDVGEE